MADNILYVMNVCDHYVDHGIVVDVLKTFMMSLLVIKVIVLWGDHGWQLGEHSEWCKHTNFDVRFRILDVQN